MGRFVIFSLVILTIALGLTLFQKAGRQVSSPLPNSTSSPTEQAPSSGRVSRVSIVSDNLEIPWEMVFLPEKNDILLTERVGNLKLISKEQPKIIAKIPDVKVYGEGGLMGLALHPNFESNNYIYLYYTFAGENDRTLNRVVRYKFSMSSLSERKIIIDNIPGAIFHNGGRIKFGPDGFLYVTTGDSLNPSLAQNTNSLAGKILRTTDEGKMVSDNPFNNLVYSYGHRNPQGLAWDGQGRLWETEHGPSATDEVNIIVKGRNYGWPEIKGKQRKDGFESPFVQSGQETWAPAGAVILNSSLFFSGLKGEALFELQTENGIANIKAHFKNEFGRIRNVVLGPDSLLYISTSNRDGRGNPNSNDDKILKIDPKQL